MKRKKKLRTGKGEQLKMRRCKVAHGEERTTLVQGVVFRCPMCQQDTESAAKEYRITETQCAAKEYLRAGTKVMLNKSQVKFV